MDPSSLPEHGDVDKMDAITPKETVASYEVGSIEKLDNAINREFYGSSVTDAYRLKSELVNKCMEDIGMGRYQWELFVVTGFGWITDNFWSQSIGTIQPPLSLEMPNVVHITSSSIAYYAGLIVGATFWGVSSDFIGRKPAFNATILIGAIFGAAVAGLDNFVGLCIMWSIIGTAAGGNVPVDSMIFLEFAPGSHQYLLTALSAWWMIGQLIVSLLGWVYLAHFSCSTTGPCDPKDNMGWRYLMITLGVLALSFALIRILVFKMPESPKYLLSKGRDAEAVESVNYVARRNKRPEPLTLSMLQAIDAQLGITPDEQGRLLSRKEIIKENLSDFKTTNYKSLFATKKLAQHTTLIWAIWLIIGIGYPLYFNFLPTYLAQRFTTNNSIAATYRTYCITSAVSVVGPILASILVNTRMGRCWTMGGSAILTGIFLFAYTAVRTRASDLAFNCVTGLLGNFMYAIMYAFTPESFPAPHRGLGTGQAATLLRLGGLAASLIGTYTNFSTAPIYISASFWILVGLMCFGLPFDTQGHAAI